MNRWERFVDPVPGYVDDLLSNVPPDCREALDVGCGTGDLTRRLAARSGEVLGVDRAAHMIEIARSLSGEVANVSFEVGDFLTMPLPEDRFDFVLAVASIHHMDFESALSKMAAVTRCGGVVAVLGLAKEASILDVAASVAGAVQLHTVGRRRLGGANVHNMPLLDATMTYGQVRQHAAQLLPDHRYRRHPVFRYSLVWRKPS